MNILDTAEGQRLRATRRGEGWRRWGPYVSERQWGTVREDYSPGGTAWDSFPHDHARSRAYRWGEDGLAGFGHERLLWCLGLALWNERDPILKERMFGLTNSEGNHGEDVKEAYHYLDGTPTHSYMRMLYRYPQRAFPYADLAAENRRRTAADPEYDLEDTGVFEGERFFDVTVEYAKASPDDILMQVTAHNRGPDPAPLHLLPHLWARNTWSWKDASRKPMLQADGGGVLAQHPRLHDMRLDIAGPAEWLFCENETNVRRMFGSAGAGPFKDGINDCVVHGDHAAVSATGQGTKCAAHLRFVVPPGSHVTVQLRFRPADQRTPFASFDLILQARRAEADEFYAALQHAIPSADARLVQRQALAGLLWSKQLYLFDVSRWLDGDPAQPQPPPGRNHGRNRDWRHLNNADIVSMPDKWEYPWYAAWDLAFHCVSFALVDPEFAKDQLVLMTREWYMHPNGQLPAYEWAFGDVNPPVHAWAVWRVFEMDRALTGVPDRAFLERVFHKLLLNFTWWVNRKDADGRNVFQGGFLGLDNVGLFDRSAPLPTGGTMDQADGTAWMAMYTLNLLRIAIELAHGNAVYEDLATKFFEHFLHIAEAMTDNETAGLWDEVDGFYYDTLRLPDGRSERMRIRSMVGLIPFLAVEVIDNTVFDRLPEFTRRLRWFLRYRPDLANLISRWAEPGTGERHLLSLLRGHRMKRLLRRMLDEAEMLSPHGVRSVSKAHAAQPFRLVHAGVTYAVGYEPGESRSKVFGGNSNWRGPVWMPLNALLIESLRRFHSYYGDDFRVECPVGSGEMRTLAEVADELSARLVGLFLAGPDGIRPAMAGVTTLDGVEPALLFHEFFHGDTGRGLGASHQTGWTSLVALLIAQSPAGHGPSGQ